MRNFRLCLVALALVVVVSALTLADDPVRFVYAAGSTNHPDPQIGTGALDCTVYVNVYDSLLYPTPEAELEPHMAESWSVSEDGLVYTFVLREGIPFHDGSEVLAEDVVFSLNRFKALRRGFSYLFEVVGSVEAADEYTVRITLDHPYPLFPWNIVRLYVMNKDYVLSKIEPGEYGEYGDYGVGYFQSSGDDAGSGPYRIVEYEAGTKTVMQKFTDYSLGGGFVENAPDIVTATMVIDPVAQKAMFRQKQLDIGSQWAPKEWNDDVAQYEGVTVAGLFVSSTFQLQMNTQKPPLDCVHVRRALSYLVDYETVVTHLWPTCERAIGPVPQAFLGHNPDLFVFDFDLEKAREELEQSKYYGRFDTYPIRYVYVETVPDEEKLGLLLKSAAAQVGLTIEVVRSPWVRIVDGATTVEGSEHIYAMFASADNPEAVSMLQVRYHSDAAGRYSQTEWLMNPEVDALIDDALRTSDEELRWAKARAIQSRIIELCPTVYLFDFMEPRAYQSAYIDWPFAHDSVPLLGYNFAARFISVDQEAKEALQR